MAIRFIDSNLPDKNWFIDLEPIYKSVWIHLILKCNHAGIWNVSIKLLKVFIGGNEDLTEESILKMFGKRIVPFDNDKWFLPGFVTFQYKHGLNPAHRVHKSVIEILNKQDLMRYLRDFDESYMTLIRPINDSSMTKGRVKIESKMSDKTKSKTKIRTKDKDNIPKNDLIEAERIINCFLDNRIIEKDIDSKEFKKWVNEIYKLVRIDKEDWSEIERVIRLVLADDFWKTVVHSPLKFRRKDKEGIRNWDKFKQLSKQNSKGRTQIQGNENYNESKL